MSQKTVIKPTPRATGNASLAAPQVQPGGLARRVHHCESGLAGRGVTIPLYLRAELQLEPNSLT